MDQTVNKMSSYAAALTNSDLTPEALHAVKRPGLAGHERGTRHPLRHGHADVA
jgi:hypothetical protein